MASVLASSLLLGSGSASAQVVRLGVGDLQNLSAWSAEQLGPGATELLKQKLVESGHFVLIDLGPALAEQQLSAAGVLEVGRALGVDYVLVGGVNQFAATTRSLAGNLIGGSTTRVEAQVTARLVSAADGTTIAGGQSSGEGSTGRLRVSEAISESNWDQATANLALEPAIEELVGTLIRSSINPNFAWVSQVEPSSTAGSAGDLDPNGLPALEWPLPSPTGFHRTSLDALTSDPASVTTMGAASDVLLSWLSSAGHAEATFFSVPGGIALISPWGGEAFDDRTARPSVRGFVVPSAAEGIASTNNAEVGRRRSRPNPLLEILRRPFVRRDSGLFRQFVVVLTTEVLNFGLGEQAPTPESTGSIRLPNELRDVPLTDLHNLTILVYEFRKEGGPGTGLATLVEERTFEAQCHLVGSGLLEASERVRCP